ncbi:hypothetical protein D3C80_1608120 [compost metagenome]
MVAIEIAHAAAPAQRIVAPQLHAGVAQAPAIDLLQSLGAVIVEQTAHLDAALRRRAQGLQQGFHAGATGDQIQLQHDQLAGSVDGPDHPREEGRAIVEQGKLVAAAPGENHPRHQ